VAMSRVLVLRALGLGDLLTAVPALRGLRKAMPRAEITLAAPEGLRALAKLTGAVDRLLPTPGLGKLRWSGPGPELAVNLHGRGPESVADLLGTRPASILGHGGSGPQWIDELHEVDRWCRLLRYGGIVSDPTDLALPLPPVPSPAPGAVVIHPGAAFPARRWSPERFAAVARTFPGDVVISGGPAEVELASHVARLAGLSQAAVLAGRTALTELAALVAGAALVVCGDTGPGHLATAFGTPSVLLFGPTLPQRWGPPPAREEHVVLWHGGIGDPFGSEPDPGLLEITPAEVLAAAARALAGKPMGAGRA
jgi:ADP-heptose:LPS heptosyltransferase